MASCMIGIKMNEQIFVWSGPATKLLANQLGKIDMKVKCDLCKVICAWNDLYGMAGANF